MAPLWWFSATCWPEDQVSWVVFDLPRCMSVRGRPVCLPWHGKGVSLSLLCRKLALLLGFPVWESLIFCTSVLGDHLTSGGGWLRAQFFSYVGSKSPVGAGDFLGDPPRLRWSLSAGSRWTSTWMRILTRWPPWAPFRVSVRMRKNAGSQGIHGGFVFQIHRWNRCAGVRYLSPCAKCWGKISWRLEIKL